MLRIKLISCNVDKGTEDWFKWLLQFKQNNNNDNIK